MIVKMAIAKENFIDTNETPSFDANDTFLQCLQKIFPFVDTDILEFDGNSFQMVNSYDPTNSIFIYTNQQGTFLYTITSATPRVHKNNMVWNCLCYKMEDMSAINDIINERFIPIVYKNIFDLSNSTYKHQNVEIKDNFKTQQTEFIRISNIFCLKLKFLVNPTTDTTIETREDDGSWNFFFPLRFIGTNTPGSLDDPYPILKGYYKFYYNNVAYDLDEIIKNNSANLKSAELLPFFPCEDDVLGGTVTFSIQPINELTIDTITGAKVTTAGIFFPYGHSTKRSDTTKITTTTPLNREILNGGGVRGFYSTPLGNFNIDFQGFQNAQYIGTDGKTNKIYAYLDCEGWKIDGLFQCKIAPHYINFYTDETSQFLINNMTTNAQELRQINREYETQHANLLTSTAGSATTGLISNLVSGNIQSVIGGLFNQGVGLATEEINNQRNYQTNVANFKDKIETQKTLASMSGKSVNGNISLSSVIPNFSINDFVLVLEYNFTYGKTDITGSEDKKEFYITQRDYDYSTNTLNENIIEENTVLTSAQLLFASLIYSARLTEARINYSLVFKLSNIPSLTSSEDYNIKQTQVLKFDIRNKLKNTLIS